jgi:hypothetical protein
MTDLPDTSWDKDFRKTIQECIDAKAQAAGRPSPLMLPVSGPSIQALGIGRGCWGKTAIPTVETRRP